MVLLIVLTLANYQEFGSVIAVRRFRQNGAMQL
jgi:hypothetical protein